MTNKVNVRMIMYKRLRSKTPVLYMIATASLIVVMSIGTSVSEHSVNAQIRMGHHDGNITAGLQELQQKVMANGTINLEQTILNAIGSKVKTSLTQAMITAERTVGNNSFAVAGFGGEYGGYFAYQIILGMPGIEFYTVLVDPGNGHILATDSRF